MRRVCTSDHCNVFCKYERLSVDSFFDTPHVFQFTVVCIVYKDCNEFYRGVLVVIV